MSIVKLSATGAASRPDRIMFVSAGSFSTSGTQKRNVLPCSGLLSTSRSPPCARTMARAIASPIPVPFRSVALFLPR